MRADLLLVLLCLTSAAFAGNGSLDPSFGVSGVARTNISGGVTAYSGAIDNRPVVQPDNKFLICSSQNVGGTSGTDFLVSRFTANGVLDSTFSFDGKVTIDFDGGAGADYCTGIALQADGKIVLIGTTSGAAGINGSDFAIARLNSDGTLDPTFGAGTGKTTVGFDLGTSNNDVATGIALQSDGKIVIGGYAATATALAYDFAAVRLNTDGTRDAAFNLTGKVHVGFNLATNSKPNSDVAASVAIDASGNILLVGSVTVGSSTPANTDIGIVRLLSDGALDNNFDADGRVTVAFDLGGISGSNSDQAVSILVQHDGRIVLGGFVDVSTTATQNFDMALARLQPDGSLDASFGIGGKTLISFDLTANGKDLILDMVQQSNEKLLLVGAAQTGAGSSYNVAVARLNSNGGPDSEFGSLGKTNINLGVTMPAVQLSYGVALQGTQILVSGIVGTPMTNQYDNFVLRLQNDLIFANGFN